MAGMDGTALSAAYSAFLGFFFTPLSIAPSAGTAVRRAAAEAELHLIVNIAVAVAVALVGGLLAHRLRQPVIVGYLLAGVAIGPFTPGFIGDREQIASLADVGDILLLFALGVEFSLRDLRSVRDVALPGGVLQVALV